MTKSAKQKKRKAPGGVPRPRSGSSAISPDSGPSAAVGKKKRWKLAVCVVLATMLAVLSLLLFPDGDLPESARRPRTGQSPAATLTQAGPEESLVTLQPLATTSETLPAADLERELTQMAEELTDFFPVDPKAWHVAAQVHAELDQTEKARQAWRQSVARKPKNPGPYVGLAALLLSLGEDAKAKSVCEQALANGVQSLKLALRYAESLERSEETQVAISVLQRAAESESTLRDTRVAAVWQMLGRLQSQLGNFADAEVALKRCLELEPRNRSAVALLVTVAARNRNAELVAKSQKQLQELQSPAGELEHGGDQFEERFDMATQEFAQQQFLAAGAIAQHYARLEQAELWFRRAQSLDVQALPAYEALSAVLRQQARWREAIEVHRRIVELRPKEIANYTNLASLAMQIGDVTQAESVLLRAIELDPEGSQSQSALARIYAAQQKWTEALELAKQAADEQPDVDALAFLASLYEASGNLVAAQATRAEAAKVFANESSR